MRTIESGSHTLTPPSQEVRNTTRRLHEEKINRVAYSIHERRVLRAPEDPYEKTMLDNVDPGELARRDYLLATSLVNSGATEALRVLDAQLVWLRDKNKRP